ncbi:MAG: hypothetical protein HKM93_06850 [Desulfobacteraceae bacterium]|nr:hypothetical protein [Desulfobacteraceae bacterium]
MISEGKMIAIIVMTVICTAFLGCTDSSVFSDTGYDLQISMQISDDGTGSSFTKTIDVASHICVPDDPATPANEEEWEDIFDAIASASFDSEQDGPDRQIDEYTVRYIPQESPDGSGGTFMPPDLEGFTADTTIIIPSGSVANQTVVALDILTKAEYWTEVTDAESIYTIRITFRGKDENGESFSVTVDEEVLLADYDTCDA